MPRNKTKSSGDITLKEIYERVIILETKMDGIEGGQLIGRKHSTKLTAIILFGIFIDIVIHLVLMLYL